MINHYLVPSPPLLLLPVHNSHLQPTSHSWPHPSPSPRPCQSQPNTSFPVSYMLHPSSSVPPYPTHQTPLPTHSSPHTASATRQLEYPAPAAFPSSHSPTSTKIRLPSPPSPIPVSPYSYRHWPDRLDISARD